MCELNKKLKLCTCAVASTAELEHSWVLHRFNKTKDDLVIGRVGLPDTLGKKVEAYNRALLLERLNEDDAFDVNLSPQEGDRLQLTFTCSEPGLLRSGRVKTITYGYTYKNGRWVEEPFDPLSWQWHHDREKFGEIQAALHRTSRA